MNRSLFLAVLGAAALFVACSGGESDPDGSAGTGGTGGAGGSGGSGGTGGGGGDEDVCTTVPLEDGPLTGWTPELPASFGAPVNSTPRDSACAAENGWVSAIRGWVAAPGGAPLAKAKAQACIVAADSIFSCLAPVDVNADGVFTIELRSDIHCLKRAAVRIWEPRTGRATYYRPLDIQGDDPVIRLEEPAVLPFATPAVSLPPKGDKDAPRPVVFDDGLTLEVTPSLYWSGTGTYACFAGRRIPTDAVGLIPGSGDFDGVYAFFPEGEMVTPGEPGVGYPLTIPNPTDVPAGAAVELFVLGGLECHLLDGTLATEGYWEKFGEGTVSEDGATITSNPDSGLPCLNWFAYRRKE